MSQDAQHHASGREELVRLAADQAVLANERTFLAWLRTGLSAVAAALAMLKLAEGLMPFAILLTVTLVLMAFGVGNFWAASWRYRHIHLRNVHLDISALSPRVASATSWILVATSVLAFLALLLDFKLVLG